MARPFGSTKLEFNQQLIDEWRAFGKCGLKLKVMAGIKGVSPQTISAYHAKHPELVTAYDEGLSVCEANLKSKAIELAEAGNLEAIKYVNKHITDWKDTNRIESEHTEKKVILIRNEKSLSQSQNRIEECLPKS
jgi:hypothetical protein